jgi:hypothetical protein
MGGQGTVTLVLIVWGEKGKVLPCPCSSALHHFFSVCACGADDIIRGVTGQGEKNKQSQYLPIIFFSKIKSCVRFYIIIIIIIIIIISKYIIKCIGSKKKDTWGIFCASFIKVLVSPDIYSTLGTFLFTNKRHSPCLEMEKEGTYRCKKSKCTSMERVSGVFIFPPPD